MYNIIIMNNKSKIDENKIWVFIDETCDVEGRFIDVSYLSIYF